MAINIIDFTFKKVESDRLLIGEYHNLFRCLSKSGYVYSIWNFESPSFLGIHAITIFANLVIRFGYVTPDSAMRIASAGNRCHVIS